mgnify:CR=1 FL=1
MAAITWATTAMTRCAVCFPLVIIDRAQLCVVYSALYIFSLLVCVCCIVAGRHAGRKEKEKVRAEAVQGTGCPVDGGQLDAASF